MNKICPVQLQAALQAWSTEGLGLNLEEKASAIVIDGKVLRGTHSDHARTMQIHAALDQYTGCMLSETQVAADTASASSSLNFRVESLEFYSGVLDFELPVDSALFVVGAC